MVNDRRYKIAHQQHAQKNLGVDRGAPQRALSLLQSSPHKGEIHRPVRAFEEVVLRDLILHARPIEEWSPLHGVWQITSSSLSKSTSAATDNP